MHKCTNAKCANAKCQMQSYIFALLLSTFAYRMNAAANMRFHTVHTSTHFYSLTPSVRPSVRPFVSQSVSQSVESADSPDSSGRVQHAITVHNMYTKRTSTDYALLTVHDLNVHVICTMRTTANCSAAWLDTYIDGCTGVLVRVS